MWGCRVVGIAGSPAKCEWLTGELKLDAAINYRTQDVRAAVAETCPDGVDVYFDNVGGATLETALFAMRDRGRVVCCGAVSGYDGAEPPAGPRGIPGLLIARRLTMRGFIVTDFAPRFRDGIQALVKWIDTGYVKVREDRVDGLEHAPEGLVGLLAGENIGKRYVHVADRLNSVHSVADC
jgi:NADPH-dependent curcumin reductase CurA